MVYAEYVTEVATKLVHWWLGVKWFEHNSSLFVQGQSVASRQAVECQATRGRSVSGGTDVGTGFCRIFATRFLQPV